MGIYIRTADSWEEIGDLRRYNGTQWESASLSRFSGSQWEKLWPVHFARTAQYSLKDYVVYSQSGYSLISSSYLCVGSQSGYGGTYYDTLLFFPMDQLMADMGTAVSITGATLTLRRRLEDSGPVTTPITLGCALSGVDPASPPSKWTVKYQELLSESVRISENQTRTFSFSTKGISALLDGTADCLCLPTSADIVTMGNCYAQFIPEDTVLTVSYIS